MSEALRSQDDLQRTRLKVRCAQLYYGLIPGARGDLRQSDVARRLGVPRSQVVQWLKEARERLIEVRLRAPRALALELPLLERLRPWGVREVRVALDGGLTEEGAREAVGAEAARALLGLLGNGRRVGLAGGRTLLAAVREVLRGERLPRLSLYPLAAGGPLAVSANALVAMLAGHSAPGSEALGLWVPPLGGKPAELRAFLLRSEVQAVYRAAQRVDVALLGVGAVKGADGQKGMRDYLGASPAAARSMARDGASGFVLQQFIDERGRDHPCPLGQRNLAVPLAAIRRAARAHPRRAVVLAASGAGKTGAVAAAVRGGLSSVLVVDTVIAERLLGDFQP